MSLVNDLINRKYLKTEVIIRAFRKIKRDSFVLPKDIGVSEVDKPLSIGFGQTISQPSTVAFMLELLSPQKNDRILDMGSGSGWTAALLSEIVGENGAVFGLEIVDELVEFASSNIEKFNFIEKGITKIYKRDGYCGLPEFAPFDKIIISASVEEIPKKLLGQLKIGGRMILPIGKPFETQEIMLIVKRNKNKFIQKRYPGFIFVPLIKK